MKIKTYTPKPDDIQHEWFVIDAKDQTLGRLATQIAQLIRGKHKPTFAPHVDGGDFVVVINCEKIHVTGKKLDKKIYYRHSQYPGGLKARTLREQLAKFPDRVIFEAVKGMLPRNKLGRKMIKKLKIYTGENHPHQAQQPKMFELK